ncbi:MAG TPA: hypothetical protein VI321_09255, partial [Burkholderiales bacterium]
MAKLDKTANTRSMFLFSLWPSNQPAAHSGGQIDFSGWKLLLHQAPPEHWWSFDGKGLYSDLLRRVD